MNVVGIDLAGPSNAADTAIAVFSSDAMRLASTRTVSGADDRVLLDLLSGLIGDGPLVVGLDAPLSYNPGGGDRPADARLRRIVVQAGLRSGTVMPPTMTRMAYLTLRGVCVARALASLHSPAPQIVEVHPAACLVLRGAAVADVRALKKDARARRRLLRWLDQCGLGGAAGLKRPTDHMVAACACALAAWKWAMGDPVWCERAAGPLHPYDFAC